MAAFRRPRTDARSALKSLPVEPDTFAKWKECRAGLDYHVELDKHYNYYSVPHQLLREKVWRRATWRRDQTAVRSHWPSGSVGARLVPRAAAASPPGGRGAGGTQKNLPTWWVAASTRNTLKAIWWQDEARIGQQGTLTRVWAERDSRPRAPRDQSYDWAYLFGAVCPARDIGAALVLALTARP